MSPAVLTSLLPLGNFLLTETNSIIYEVLSNRLQRIWGYYLTFQAKAEAELTAPLSSAPCTPAPGRRIIIIRCDNPLSSSNVFVSLDRVVPPIAPPEQSLRDHSTAEADSTESQPPQKRRWSVLKSMFGGSARSGDGSSSSDDSDSNVIDGATTPEEGTNGRGNHRNSFEAVRPKTPHQPYTFRFSLEWMDRPQWPSKNKRLFAPCLPVGAQLHLQRRHSGVRESEYDTASDYESESGTEESRSSSHQEKSVGGEQVKELAPFNIDQGKILTKEEARCAPLDNLAASKYAGRALAEWAQVVSECDSFFARRRDEGVPSDRMVETPTLGVESFRK